MKKDITKAQWEAEIANATSKLSNEVLSTVKAELVEVKADWAWERERAELELVNAKKEKAEAVEKFKTFEDFVVENAQAIADFQKLKEFFALYRDFG